MDAEPTPLAVGGVNAVGRMLGLLGDEWTLLLIQQALLGVRRYGEFAAALPISHSVLASRLSAMTDAGLLQRTVYQARPPRAEYLLTQRGGGLWPVLASIWAWERRWVPVRSRRLPAMRHSGCGAVFTPRLVCRACEAPTSEKDLSVAWGPSGSWPRSMPEQATRRRSTPGAGLFPETMTILGNRWAFSLLVAAFVGTSRFGDFAEQLGAPPGTLADRLRTLTAVGVLDDSGGRYLLTEKGRAVFAVVVTALQWAQRWYAAPEGPAVVLHHTACGSPFQGVLTCDQCARNLRGNSLKTD